ncbi:MAG: helix-turn-helix domain-containing protein [Candidatus Hydrogenedentota bacterium]
MARIRLVIDDDVPRLTLKAMLEAEGHSVSTADFGFDLTIADSPRRALEAMKKAPALILSTATQLPEAITCMKQGVFGYVFVPFLAGEVGLMVTRALGGANQSVRRDVDELMSLDQAEMDHIKRVMRACKHNQAKAARILGIGRNTLWRKLRDAQQESSGV